MNCVGPLVLIPVLDEKETTARIPEQWQRYGAYYIVDDVILSSTYNAAFRSGQTRFTLFSKIKILNSGGSRFGTIPVPHYTDHCADFNVTLIDSAGQPIPVDCSKIRSNYRETGKVVVPHVTPGSVISLHMVFDQERTPTFFEHWFARHIPVATGRFVVSSPDDSKFKFKHAVYGTRARPEEHPLVQYGNATTSWIVKNLEPIDSVLYRRRTSDAEPRVAVTVDPLYGFSFNEITAWSDMAPLFNRALVEPALEGSAGAIRKKAEELIASCADPYARAQTIVRWVQNNISCSFRPFKLTLCEALKNGKSDLFRTALLCREMLRSVDVSADLMLTRAHSRGGFDKGFLSPLACGEGIIVIKIRGKTYGASPAYSGYPVGSYPSDYFDLYGLNLDEGSIMPLPKPLWNRYIERSKTTLFLSAATKENTLHQSFQELSACTVREEFAQFGNEKQREWVEHLINRRCEQNSLSMFEVHGFESPDSSVEISAVFHNNNQPVEIAGTHRHDLSSFLSPLFSQIDTTRHSEIVVSTPKYYLDTVEVIKENGINITLEMTPGLVKNQLFDSRFSVEECNDAFSIIREVSIHNCTVSEQQLPAIVTDIQELEKLRKIIALVKVEPSK